MDAKDMMLAAAKKPKQPSEIVNVQTKLALLLSARLSEQGYEVVEGYDGVRYFAIQPIDSLDTVVSFRCENNHSAFNFTVLWRQNAASNDFYDKGKAFTLNLYEPGAFDDFSEFIFNFLPNDPESR